MLTLLMLLAACRHPAPPPLAEEVEAQPEEASGCRTGLEPVRSEGAIVVAAHPEAARIGAEVLARGGTAVDAATAVAVALTLVEPQSSGIGGGAFVLHHDAETGALTAWDGRETAPAAATPDLFYEDGTKRAWTEVVPTGSSVGAPGLLAVLDALHEEQGALPWAELMTPTIELAERGFVVTSRLSRGLADLEDGTDAIRRHEAARAYFYPDGQPLQPGDTRTNPALADALRQIAEGGVEAFYEGPIAEHVVAAVRSTDPPGRLTVADLAAYEPVKREPVCVDYRGNRVCGHPPPTSGGIAVLQILELLEPFEVGALAPDAPEWVHLFAEASRLAFADRDRYVADPDAVAVPTAALLDETYLASRSAAIDPAGRLSEVTAGDLPLPPAPTEPLCPEGADTTHLVVVDAAGDVVSMTSSIENAFGSGILVDGFLLNNQLTDFSFAPTEEGRAVANAVASCKRPRSSMAPIVAYGPDGEVRLAIGSPGGSRIIHYVARALVGVLDHDLDVQAAIARPNAAIMGGKVELEVDCGTPRWPASTEAALEALGHDVIWKSTTSGLHGVQRVDGGWIGGVDPRREGEVRVVE